MNLLFLTTRTVIFIATTSTYQHIQYDNSMVASSPLAQTTSPSDLNGASGNTAIKSSTLTSSSRISSLIVAVKSRVCVPMTGY